MKTRTHLCRRAAVALGVCIAASHASAGEIFVSPRPSPGGDGSRARPLGLEAALAAGGPARPGDVIWLLGGRYEGRMDEKRGRRIPFRFAAAGAAGRPVRVRPVAGASVHLNGPVAVAGAHAEYVGLEIGDRAWTPTGGRGGGGFAVDVGRSKGIRLINCNLFGLGGGGIRADVAAEDLEVYGCLVHDFGRLAVQRVPMDIGDIEAVSAGVGTGFLSANKAGTKTLTHNVFYRGCGGNLQLSTYTVGYDFIENISYLSKGLKPNENMDSFPICSNYHSGPAVPMDRIRLIGNVAYQPIDISAWRPNARLISYRPAVLNGAAVFKGNYLIGAARGLDLTRWKRLEVSGNTLWATKAFISINLPGAGKDVRAELKGFTFAGNTYIDNGRSAGFLVAPAVRGQGRLSFAQWQALGFDKDSRVAAGKDGRPAGTRAFVFPNRHEKGRAHVAVFCWEGKSHVDVDLSAVLRAGRKYRIYNVLDITHTIGQAKPVLTGTHGGAPVRLPLRRSPASPDFDAFLVLADGD